MLMTIQRGEVMWPRLIASKILGKRLGSNNFVADFPSSLNSLLDLPNMDLEPADSRRILSSTDDHKDTHNYNLRLFVSTWNVGGLAPTDDLNIEDLLDTCNTPCDIYVLGFQEVVPLRAANVLGSEKDKLCMKWNSLIRKTLNKNTNNQCSDSNDSSIQNEYCCLISKQMVGILISVWIRNELHPYIRNPNVSCVGCGVIGCLGNKGSVSVRFRLHETSFCFVCTHLASGGRLGDGKARNSNAIDILSRTRFPKGPELDLPPKILDHSQVILLGDLNYRISLPEHETRFLVHKGEWSCLLENDQLGKELTDGQAFDGWHEGTINFPPTYKYCPNSDAYYGSYLGEGKKKRAPAWCDRIIWFGKGLQQHLYTRSESKLSDHRPVKAIFTSEVRVLQTVKGFPNFFLSEGLDDKNSSGLDKESSYCGRSSL